jgi:hypothetical protein
MKIAFDIGGVLSKFPSEIGQMMTAFAWNYDDVYVITDQHPKDEVFSVLKSNQVHVLPDNVLCSDYEKHGDACKAVLLREHGIDILVDDHPGYLVWPWPTPAPLRLRVEPDPRRPYWHPSWKQDGGDFGRRVFVENDPEIKTDGGIGTCSECPGFYPMSQLHPVGDWLECDKCFAKRQENQ